MPSPGWVAVARSRDSGGSGGGYLGQRQSVVEAITAKVELLNTYAEGLSSTADNLESGDQA